MPGVASARSRIAAIVRARITAMRSLMPRISGSSDEIMMIASPCSASRLHQRVDFGLRADVDALRRLVENQDRRARSTSQRASATFCWLPPDSVPTSAATDGVLIRSRST